MKYIRTTLLGLLAAAGLAACSSDTPGIEPEPTPVPGETGEMSYLSLDILMPNGKSGSIMGRSSTDASGGSSDGVEVGSDAENRVSSALIVLARKDADPTLNYGFIAAGEVASNRLTPMTSPTEKAYKAVTRVYKTNLNNFYEELANRGTSPEVYVFVFCNPTAELQDMFTGAQTTYGTNDWIDRVCKVTDGITGTPDVNTDIWANDHFLMNNVSLCTRMLPASLADWDNFDRIDNPFHLSDANATTQSPDLPDNSAEANRGPIRVERSVARLDFRDGSPTNNRTYSVLFHLHDGVAQDGTNGTTPEPLVAVRLDKMALVNMSNSFYYLPRVSDNGLLDGTGYALLGSEKMWARDEHGAYQYGNYVVGPWASTFYGGNITSGFSSYFNFPFFDDNGEFNNATMVTDQWYVSNIATILNNGQKDNYENDGARQYNVWRYVTENVIPDGPAKQMNGISTGMVFKAKMLGTDFAANGGVALEHGWDEGLHQAMANCLNGKAFRLHSQDHAPIKGNSKDDPILYYYDGQMYLTWNNIRQAAIQASITHMASGSYEINRSNSLYRAVFGDGPIPTYTRADGTTSQNQYWDGSKYIPVNDPMWNTPAGKAAWINSPDYAWTQWDLAGKPVPEVVGVNVPATLTAMRNAVTNAGITIYQSSVDPDNGVGYYCYYYYWIRHNDNGLNGVMGPMEFNVVRNNVYKMSVNKIARLGHPRIPGNDPERPTPTTPDESDDIYLDVTLEITPWAVRVNSVEF